MELGYEIHSNMNATHIDKTLCSQTHLYILSEKFLHISSVWVAGLWGEGLGEGKGARWLPERKARSQTHTIPILEVKDEGHEDKDRKTGINTSGCKHDLEYSTDGGNT